MPTINEVWEQALQINANLVIVHNDLTGLQTAIGARLDNLTGLEQETNARLHDLRNVVAGGLGSLSLGIAGLQQRQTITNQLLQFQTQQQETIICILEKIARNTCAIQNEAHEQTGLQKNVAENAASIRHMFSTQHPGAALELDREMEQRREIERCCPPQPPAAPCVDQPCPVPARPEVRPPDNYPVYNPPPEDVPGREQPR